MPKKFTSQQIKNDPIMKKFLNKKLGRMPTTISGYMNSIKSFCNFTGKSPTEIHDLHRSDLRNRVAEFDMWLNEAFDEYIADLTASNYSYATIHEHITKVKGFFHTFKLKPTPQPTISKKHIPEDSKYALSVEDIRKALKNSNPTYQALFITQAQTGLSLSDALLLDVEDFVQAVSKKNENITVNEAIYRVKKDNIIGCFDLRRKKSSMEFYTFVGPEALRYIASLLESRDERYLKPKNPIFLKDTTRLKKTKKYCLQDWRLTPNAAKNYVGRMNTTRKIFPRIIVDGKERNYFRTHKLRKWFSNQVRFKAGFSAEDTKYLMGQKTGDVLEKYIDTNNYNALKGNYRKALPYLAINDEIVMEENQEALEKLEKENESLKEKMRIEKEQHQAEMAGVLARLESVEQMKEKVENVDNWMKVLTTDGLKSVSEEEMKKIVKDSQNVVEKFETQYKRSSREND